MHVIITGANGTLGHAVLRRQQNAGARVASVHGASGNDDPAAGTFRTDNLADEAEAREVIGRASEWLGAIDSLIHLAGGFSWIEVGSSKLADWRAMFDANIATAVATIGAALPTMRDGGSIVLVGANSAQPAGAGFGPYGAAKSGVARLVEALSIELRPRRIRVNAVLPAIIDTPKNRSDMPDANPETWTGLDAIADVIAFLVSDHSRAINGALVPVTNAAR